MLTLPSALDRAVRLFGHRPAIVDAERNFTWAEHAERVARAAGALAGLGIGAGDRFAIVAQNSYRQAELLHAGYWMGAVPVPINYRLAVPEVLHILNDSGAKMLIVEDEFAGLLDADELAPWRGGAVCLSAGAAPGGRPRFEDLLAAAEAQPMREADEDEDATLLYTGGTTGRAKGVRLSHRNVIMNGLQVAGPMAITQNDVYLHVAPMFHAADLLGTAFTLAGAAHGYVHKFSGQAVLRQIQDRGVTVTMMGPTLIMVTLQEKDFDSYDLSRLRLLFYGSAPMDAEWTRRAMAKFADAELIQGYGLTETAPILTLLGPAEHRRAIETGDYDILRAAGRPVRGIDLRIFDDRDHELPQGQVGEVVVRGPNVTRGYLNLPEVNAETFRGGWFHTGDLGYVDERGFMYLKDRKKDMIITGGENVYSSEVEAVLYQHPDVHECAVIGVPDEKYGEALFAVIVARPGAELSEESIIEHCRSLIGGYKIPRKMAFLDELPKTAVGKIQKVELRRIYGGA